MAIGKASVFKFIADDSTYIGAVSGVVGLAGGLGGFVLSILFGALVDVTGVRSSASRCCTAPYACRWCGCITRSSRCAA
jgi:nitrate/nitrite transporter NarK